MHRRTMESLAPTTEDASPYERLKLLILSGEIGMGQPLAERSLAERLGVSRTPVRETLLRLQKEGLVQIVQGRGAFVMSYSIEDLIEIYEVRLGLEPVAARLSCPHISLEELAFFEGAFNRYMRDPERGDDDNDEWQRLGRDFHNLFIRGSRNGRLIQIMEGLQDQVELFRGLGKAISPLVVSRAVIEEHLEIVAALTLRNPRRAERAVRVHLENGLRSRIDALRPK